MGNQSETRKLWSADINTEAAKDMHPLAQVALVLILGANLPGTWITILLLSLLGWVVTSGIADALCR